MYPRAAIRIGWSFSLIIAFFAAGCGWQKPKPQKMDWHVADSAEAVVDLPPQQALAAARDVLSKPPLSIPVQSVEDGKIITGWKEYPGDVHIVRRWYERTRFRITVTPDFSNPTGRSRLRVEDQTEERATDAQPWYPAPNTRRPERSTDVLHQIVNQLQNRPQSQPAAGT